MQWGSHSRRLEAGLPGLTSQEGRYVPLPVCNNWIGIMLLSGESKVLCKIILEGMKDSFEDRLHNELAGCCNERSWCDEFATLWTILRADLGMEHRSMTGFCSLWNGTWFCGLAGALNDHVALYRIPEKIVRMIRSFTIPSKQGICRVVI